MKYKVSNKLVNTEEGKTLVVSVVFDSFEEMTDKVVRDLNSLWNGVVPFPMNFNLEIVDDSVESGMVFVEDGKTIHKTGVVRDEFLEEYSSWMNDYFDKRYLKDGGLK
jgi:hypothetical protein